MSPSTYPAWRGDFRFPRVSGDEPTGPIASTQQIAFSPRERG